MGEGNRWTRAGICLLTFGIGLGAHAKSPGPITQEIQQAYRAQDWDKVFGLALYYRLKFASADPAPLALEITALLRHCQQGTALELIALHQATFAKTEGVRAARFRDDLDRLTEIAQLKVNKASAREKQNGWPLRGDAELTKKLDAISNPLLLRMKVKNQCGA